MDKIKEIAKEKSTWVVGVPALVTGVMTLLDADHAGEVAGAISSAGEGYAESGDWKTAIGWLAAGLIGIFFRGR